MAVKKLQRLSNKEKELSFRVFNLLIKRVLKKAYTRLDENEKIDIEKIFNSGTEEEKDAVVKRYIPDFQKIFNEEAKKIENDLKEEIKKRV